MQVELFEGNLGKFVDGEGQAAGRRVRADIGDDLRIDAEAARDHEQPVLVAGRRLADVDGSGERADQGRRADVHAPDFRAVRAVRRCLAAEVRLLVGAGGLAVGGVRIDRDALRQERRRPSGCSTASGALLSGWAARQRDVEPGGRIGLLRGEARAQHRLEGLRLAVGRRRILVLRMGDLGRVLVGADVEGDGERLAGADAGVVGERLLDEVRVMRRLSVVRGAERGRGARAARRVARRSRQEAFDVVLRLRREAPDGHLRARQGDQLRDAGDRHAQAVVGSGADLDRDGDRDVELGDDEGEASGLALDLDVEVVDRGGAEQVVRVAGVVGADGHRAGLRVGRALHEGEVGDVTGRNGVGVPEDASRQVHRDVFRRLRRARFLQREARAEVGMASRGGAGCGDSKGGDRLGGCGGRGRHRQRQCADGEQWRELRGHPQLPVPPCEAHLFLLLLPVRRWRCARAQRLFFLPWRLQRFGFFLAVGLALPPVPWKVGSTSLGGATEPGPWHSSEAWHGWGTAARTNPPFSRAV